MARKRVLVVLGAGASHDVWDGQIDCSPDWTPPLARGLFELKGKTHYQEIVRHYAGAENLAIEISQMQAARREFDLEETLRAFANHSSPLTRKWFLEVPAYIRDLIGRVSSSYVRVPGNYVVLIRRLIEESNHDFAVLSLNYDTLFEQALSRFGRKIDDVSSYAKTERAFGPFVKLHGSVDWFRVFESVQSWADLLHASNLDQLSAGEIVRIRGHARTKDPHRPRVGVRAHIYPALTAPLAGKSADHYVCPTEHVDALSEWLQVGCEKLLVIGCSGLDENLLEYLRKQLPPLELVHVVGGSDVQHAADRFGSAEPMVHARLFEKSELGFRQYLETELFSSFLQFTRRGG